MYVRQMHPTLQYNPGGGDKVFRFSAGTKAGCTKTTTTRMETSVIYYSPSKILLGLGFACRFWGGGGGGGFRHPFLPFCCFFGS